MRAVVGQPLRNGIHEMRDGNPIRRLQLFDPFYLGFPSRGFLQTIGVEFDHRRAAMVVEICVIFFTPVSGIGHNGLRQLTELLFQVVPMQNQAKGIPGALMDTKAHDELIFRADLPMISGLQLSFIEMVIFHSHEGRIRIRLAKAIPIAQRLPLRLIFREPGETLLTELLDQPDRPLPLIGRQGRGLPSAVPDESVGCAAIAFASVGDAGDPGSCSTGCGRNRSSHCVSWAAKV